MSPSGKNINYFSQSLIGWFHYSIQIRLTGFNSDLNNTRSIQLTHLFDLSPSVWICLIQKRLSKIFEDSSELSELLLICWYFYKSLVMLLFFFSFLIYFVCLFVFMMKDMKIPATNSLRYVVILVNSRRIIGWNSFWYAEVMPRKWCFISIEINKENKDFQRKSRKKRNER